MSLLDTGQANFASSPEDLTGDDRLDRNFLLPQGNQVADFQIPGHNRQLNGEFNRRTSNNDMLLDEGAIRVTIDKIGFLPEYCGYELFAVRQGDRPRVCREA